MNGMFWAGVLISSVPVLVTIAAVALLWRAWQHERARTTAEDASTEEVLP